MSFNDFTHVLLGTWKVGIGVTIGECIDICYSFGLVTVTILGVPNKSKVVKMSNTPIRISRYVNVV